MLGPSPLKSLEQNLNSAIKGLAIYSREDIGAPAAVEKASKEAERVFQGIAKATPSDKDAYLAALTFMRGHSLDERQLDQLASALCIQVKEQRNARVIGHRKFGDLIALYEQEASAGQIWTLTWYGLLTSYFQFPIEEASDSERAGWKRLRLMLKETLAKTYQQFAPGPFPAWAAILNADKELLGERPASRYGEDFLEGDTTAIDKLVLDLGIPQKSWFHHEVVVECVRTASNKSDLLFKKDLPLLISLVQKLPGFRDEAIELMLNRYYKCSDKSAHAQFRDFVVNKDVWRNPKLKSAGIATAWNRVSDDVWRMVLGWVNEGNLRDFFDILAARSSADHGRLAFWSRYLEQIKGGWTRLVFGYNTIQLARTNPQIRELIAREQDAYATLNSNQGVDAFMMQIGNYIIVEFTKTPNAAYVYPADNLPFEPYARTYDGDASDLKIGFQTNAAAMRITHQAGWEHGAQLELKRLGIYPDKGSQQGRQTGSPASPKTNTPIRPSAPAEKASTEPAPPGAPFTMATLRSTVKDYGARIDDRRGLKGGRLWVEDPKQSHELSKKLEAWGFYWAEKRQAWYFWE